MTRRTPFQRRLGAFAAAQRPHGVPRLGAHAATRCTLRVGGTRPPARATPASASTRPTLDAGAGRRLRVRARRQRAARPVLALAARGPARPVAGRSTRARSRGPTATSARPRLRGRASSTSCTSARSRPRARSTARSRTCASCAELGVTAIELMPVAEFPGAPRLGLRRRLPERRAVLLRRPARAAAARRRRPRRAGSAVILDVVYNHVGASGDAGARGLRPVLHRQALRRPGATAINYDDERLRRRARVGAARAPRAGCATSTSTACGWTPSTRSSTRARAPRGRGRPPRARRAARARW